jgi:hypothetical protein
MGAIAEAITEIRMLNTAQRDTSKKLDALRSKLSVTSPTKKWTATIRHPEEERMYIEIKKHGEYPIIIPENEFTEFVAAINMMANSLFDN